MTIRLARTPRSRVALGVAIAAVAGLLSVFLSGAGHGWNTPLLVSVILWVVAPVTLYTVGQSPPPRALLYAIAAIGLVADAILIKGTIAEARVFPLYLQINGAVGVGIIAAWLFLWLLWQALVVHALVARRASIGQI